MVMTIYYGYDESRLDRVWFSAVVSVISVAAHGQLASHTHRWPTARGVNCGICKLVRSVILQ